jgi:regulator of sirC expression with transglutaminase-like and TPR domain
VELLLATARLFHLERYREETKYIYEHDAPPLDLTRCALLICNHAFPQLDHRDCYEQLEMLSACAASAVIGTFEDGYNSPGFSGLDPSNRLHQLHAVAAINQVLFAEEGFSINDADPYDPNNSYLSELLDRKQGK